MILHFQGIWDLSSWLSGWGLKRHLLPSCGCKDADQKGRLPLLPPLCSLPHKPPLNTGLLVFIISWTWRWILAVWELFQAFTEPLRESPGVVRDRLSACVYDMQNLKPTGMVSSAAARVLVYSKMLNVSWRSVTWMDLTSITASETSPSREYMQYDSFHKSYLNRQT